MVNFMHGWLGSTSNYDDLCTHVASWGFVVVSTNTERGLFPNVTEYAKDSRGLLHWAEDESQDPLSWLSGMTTVDEDFAASGHSMGGGTLGVLVGVAPRVQTVIGLQAAEAGAGEQPMADFEGRAFYIAGSVDNIVPASTVHEWTERAVKTDRNTYYEVIGMGHSGCVDGPPNGEPLPGAEQARMHRRLLTGILRAEMKGEEDLYSDLFGGGIAVEPVEIECRNVMPPVWASWDSVQQEVVVGAAARNSGTLALGWSFNTASVQTPFGLLGIDSATAVPVYQGGLNATGVLELALPVESAWLGRTMHFTALASGYTTPGFGNVASVDVP